MVRAKVSDMFKNNSEDGSILLIVLVLMSILLALSLSVLGMITFNIKNSTNQRQSFLAFQNADGGIYAVSGWMYYYKRGDVPIEVSKSKNYIVTTDVLKNTVSIPAGYSSSWIGFDAKLDSVSGSTEIEAIVFVPVAPSGYGNGG